MFRDGFVKTAFGVDPSAAGAAGGLYSSYGTGRSMAGVTANALSRQGYKTKNEESARTLAKGTSLAGGLAGLGMGYKHKGALVKRMAKTFGHNPELMMLYNGLIPFAAGTAGGAAAGVATGGAMALRGAFARKKQKKDA